MRKILVADLGEAEAFGGLNPSVQHAVTGGAEHPEHVSIVQVEGSPPAVAAVRRAMGDFKDARLVAALRFANGRQVRIASPKSGYQPVRSVVANSRAIVRIHRARVELPEAQMVAASCAHGALRRTVLLVRTGRLCSIKGLAANTAIDWRAKPFTLFRSVAPCGGGIRSATHRAITSRPVPGAEVTRAVRALPRELMPVVACGTHG